MKRCLSPFSCVLAEDRVNFPPRNEKIPVPFFFSNAKFWIKGLEQVQTKGYRYITQPDLDLINANGGNYLPAYNKGDKGWFATLTSYGSAADAKAALQLPDDASEYVGRIEFNLSDVTSNVRMAFDKNDINKALFEPGCRAFPNNGPGGGIQFLIDGVGMPVTVHLF